MAIQKSGVIATKSSYEPFRFCSLCTLSFTITVNATLTWGRTNGVFHNNQTSSHKSTTIGNDATLSETTIETKLLCLDSTYKLNLKIKSTQELHTVTCKECYQISGGPKEMNYFSL